MTNQEKNEAVARKLGHEICTEAGHILGKDGLFYDLPDYCASIEVVWGLVNTFKTICIEKGSDGIWRVYDYSGEFGKTLAEASTAPMAIVDAFLKMP